MGSTPYPPVAPPSGGTPNLPGPGQPQPMQPGEFVGGAKPNQVSFGFDLIGPPSTLYIQRDDRIFLSAQTTLAAGDTVTFLLRFLRVPEPMGGQPSDGGVGRTVGALVKGGIVDIIQKDIVIPAAQTLVLSTVIDLAEGYLLSISARATSTGQRGITFAAAQLTRFPGGTLIHSQVLFADYVTLFRSAGWPGGRYLSSIEGPGFITSVNVANPAAGADWTFTASAAVRFRVVSVNAQLLTSAAVANRIPRMLIDDGANIVSNGAPNQIVPASTTSQVTGTTTVTSAGANIPDVLCSIPGNAILKPGWRLRSNTVNIQAADQWSNIWLNLEQWIDNG
jgi:hypothetical protein